MLTPLIVIEYIAGLDDDGLEHFLVMINHVHKENEEMCECFIRACEEILNSREDIYHVDFGDERN